MAGSSPDYRAMLKCLTDHNVDFIVVGGVCAVLHGAPIVTLDLDVVHARDHDNLERLLDALSELDAYYRERPSRKLRPKLSLLASSGHQLLMTSVGPLDVLGTIGANQGYQELLPATIEIKVEKGLRVRALNLEMLIRVKEIAGRDRDRATLPILKQTLKEKRKK